MSSTMKYRRITFWELLGEFSVEIPIIQRDYAQGRPEESDIRDGFADALARSFTEDPIELDFVYGNMDRSRFQPLDGQQRLTTLFLLHWYLGTLEGCLDEAERDRLAKFTYETRSSSREFCEALVHSDLALPVNRSTSLSDKILDASWYRHAWRYDPTIQSMLVMLDAINDRFATTSGYFARLLTPEHCPIAFLLLPLEGIGLPDDLYIKMNARGKPLSPFENFKAKLERHIEGLQFAVPELLLRVAGRERAVPIHEYFSFRVDTAWARMIWQLSSRSPQAYDKCYLRFLETLFIGSLASKGCDSDVDYAINAYRQDRSIPYRFWLEGTRIDSQTIIDVIHFMDALCDETGKLHKFLPGTTVFDESAAIENAGKGYNTAAFTDRLRLYAYQQYLVKCKRNGVPVLPEEIAPWMRLVHNLVEGTAPYDDAAAFGRSIRAVDELIAKCPSIYEGIQGMARLEGMDAVQFQEEKTKAALLLMGHEWEDLITPIERFADFEGQIGFLLDFSGIQAYYSAKGNCAWPAQEDEEYRRDFAANSEKAKVLFAGEGPGRFGDHLWVRALLAIDDYRFEGGQNQNFGVRADRDTGWKRLRKGDRKENHRAVLKELFDHFDPLQPESSLQDIIIASDAIGWRRLFLDNPAILDYLDRTPMNIREHSWQGFVLLKKMRMSASHVELHTYDLFMQRAITNADAIPFRVINYYEVNGDSPDEGPCMFLDELPYKGRSFALDIKFNPALQQFHLGFFCRDESVLPAHFVAALAMIGYSSSGNRQVLSVSEEQVVELVKRSCLVLRGISNADEGGEAD